MTFTWEEVKDVRPGDVFRLHGRRYKLSKKTTTAIAIERWYWFDDLGAWIGRTFGSNAD